MPRLKRCSSCPACQLTSRNGGASELRGTGDPLDTTWQAAQMVCAISDRQERIVWSPRWVVSRSADHLDSPPRTRPVRPSKRTRSGSDGWSRPWANKRQSTGALRRWRPGSHAPRTAIDCFVMQLLRNDHAAARIHCRPRHGGGVATRSAGAARGASAAHRRAHAVRRKRS